MADQFNEQDTPKVMERPIIALPDGYANDADFLSEMRKLFADDVSFDRLNREAALEDLRFMVGDQWDDIVRQRREAARKPVLTVNRLPAFVAQIVGNRRMNETDIKIKPDNGGTISIARIREGLIRNIQKVSRAEIAFDTAFLGTVMCGIGNFEVVLDYESDDVFEQAIKFVQIPDHLSVVWDRTLTIGDGQDAGHVFVIDTMTKKDFYKTWPWATPADVTTDVTLRGDLRMNGWIAIDDVRVVSYWRMRTKKRTLALLNDGSTQDITDKIAVDGQEKDDVMAKIVQRQDGTPIMREVSMKYAQLYTCSGLDILEGPYDLPIDRVPVLRVPGWEVNVGEWRHRFGLIRFLKDPQRLHNFWRSVTAEKIMQTPRSVWMASNTAVAGRELQWRNSHLSDDPLLIWNAESGQKPERIPPAAIENALIGESEITTQDLKDVSNIHEANLGMPSNEVSGVAIQARQRVSDTGTVIYHDNLNKAIEEAGRICNQLIPTVYDTPRIVKVLGQDGKEDMQIINATSDPRSVDLSIGKYSTTVVTGPSYATKRIESAEMLAKLANAMPMVLGVALDLVIEAQDIPGGEKIAERIRKGMPPGILTPDEMSPEVQQAQAGKEAAAQQQQQQMIAEAVAKYHQSESVTALNLARAKNFETAAEIAPAKLQNESVATASQAADRELKGHLEAVKVAFKSGG